MNAVTTLEREILALPTHALLRLRDRIWDEVCRRRPDEVTAMFARLGARLIEAREQSGLDLVTVARIAGLSPGTMRRAEAGGRCKPQTHMRILRVYGLGFDWLLDFTRDEEA